MSDDDDHDLEWLIWLVPDGPVHWLIALLCLAVIIAVVIYNYY